MRVSFFRSHFRQLRSDEHSVSPAFACASLWKSSEIIDGVHELLSQDALILGLYESMINGGEESRKREALTELTCSFHAEKMRTARARRHAV